MPRALTKGNYFSDAEWTNTPRYYLKNVINGSVSNDRDFSGFFQSMWNAEYLFLKVTVQDNIKRYAQAMFDYSWIETDSGKRCGKWK